MQKTLYAIFWISKTIASRPRLFSRRNRASGARNPLRKSPIAFETGLFASSFPSSGSSTPKTRPLSASCSVPRKRSRPSTTVAGSARSAKTLGMSGLKLSQSGFFVTANENASPGLEKSTDGSIPTLMPRTFPPASPWPLKTVELIGSWKLCVPTKSGSSAQASEAPQVGVFGSAVVNEPPMSSKLVTAPTAKYALSPPECVPR